MEQHGAEVGDEAREPTKPLAVLGCGLLGAEIAALLVGAGHRVRLFDVDRPRLTALAEELGPLARPVPGIEAAVQGALLAIEAVPEVLPLKLELLSRASSADPDVILASNTSSLDVAALAAAVHRPERFLVAHFFNPASLIPLVELVPAEHTAGPILDRVAGLLGAAGKEPVILTRAVPGFVANRLQAALLREAFALEEAGIASFETIDAVVRAGIGPRWAAAGPFHTVDLGGLDVWASVCAQLFPLLAAGAEPPRALQERVAVGALGAKTGSGLFAHDAVHDAEIRARISAHVLLGRPSEPV